MAEQPLTPKEFADDFYQNLQRPGEQYKPMREFFVELERQYPQGVDDDTLAKLAKQRFPTIPVKVAAAAQPAGEPPIMPSGTPLYPTTAKELGQELVRPGTWTTPLALGWATGPYDVTVEAVGNVAKKLGFQKKHFPQVQVLAEVLRAVPEAAEFMFSPVGAAAAAAGVPVSGTAKGARIVQKIMPIVFGAAMTPQAKRSYEAAQNDPTPQNVGKAIKDIAFALAPMAGGAAAITPKSAKLPSGVIDLPSVRETGKVSRPSERLPPAAEAPPVTPAARLEAKESRLQGSIAEAEKLVAESESRAFEMRSQPSPPSTKDMGKLTGEITRQKKHLESLQSELKTVQTQLERERGPQRTAAGTRERVAPYPGLPPGKEPLGLPAPPTPIITRPPVQMPTAITGEQRMIAPPAAGKPVPPAMGQPPGPRQGVILRAPGPAGALPVPPAYPQLAPGRPSAQLPPPPDLPSLAAKHGIPEQELRWAAQATPEQIQGAIQEAIKIAQELPAAQRAEILPQIEQRITVYREIMERKQGGQFPSEALPGAPKSRKPRGKPPVGPSPQVVPPVAIPAAPPAARMEAPTSPPSIAPPTVKQDKPFAPPTTARRIQPGYFVDTPKGTAIVMRDLWTPRGAKDPVVAVEVLETGEAWDFPLSKIKNPRPRGASPFDAARQERGREAGSRNRA